jgi:hypothetical protein
MVDLACEKQNTCKSAKYLFRNNIMLGFLNPKFNSTNAQVPGLYYMSDSSNSVTGEHNIYFDTRLRTCLLSSNICSDPQFISQPARTLSSESQLDNFNFHPRKGSPAIGAGTTIDGIITDYYGVARPKPPSIGAVEP